MDAWSELYPDMKTVMHGDVDVPLSHRPRLRDLPPITAAEVAAYTGPASPPRPTITAYRGADMDAYHCEDTGGVWIHCQTGAVWSGIKCAALLISFSAVTLSIATQLRLDAWPWEIWS